MATVNTPSKLDDLKNMILKRLTLVLFVVLPARVANIFISLSIISLIFNVRNSKLSSDTTTVERVSKMLKLHLDDSLLLLPEQTCSWYWNDELLASKLTAGNSTYTMRELIRDNQLFIQHRHLVLNKLLDDLPKCLVAKLKLRHTPNKLAIKHNITSAFLYT